MARTQFTFTFTNAQPGATVGFNFPAYADASTPVADGPSVVLDSTNTVSVWADSEYLIARTVDGRGVEVVGVATVAYPTQTIDAGVAGSSPFASTAGQLCWFEKFGAHAGPATLYVTWQAISDGVAAFTDAVLDVDPTKIVVANGGAWHFDIGITFTSVATVGATPFVTVKRNTDSVGPLYDLLAKQTMAAGDVDPQTAQLGLSFDVDLAAGDVLQFHLTLPADVTVQNAVLTGRRHGPVA